LLFIIQFYDHKIPKQNAVSFGWFLDDEEIRARIQKEPEHLSTTILSMYRASNLIFCGENELQDVKSFTTDLLHKCLLTKNGEPHTIFSQFQQMVCPPDPLHPPFFIFFLIWVKLILLWNFPSIQVFHV